MRKMCFFLVIMTLIFSGCMSQKKAMYYWGDYSSSLYKYKKSLDAESLNKHKEVLAEIIEKSNQKEMRVPPGIYCEYGYLLAKEGKSEEALRYFELEKETYPESTVFIERLKSQLNKD